MTTWLSKLLVCKMAPKLRVNSHWVASCTSFRRHCGLNNSSKTVSSLMNIGSTWSLHCFGLLCNRSSEASTELSAQRGFQVGFFSICHWWKEDFAVEAITGVMTTHKNKIVREISATPEGDAKAISIDTWLILPVVICLSQRLSHACLSTSPWMVKPQMAHYNSHSLLDLTFLLG
jgi:hypothetical protein